MEWNFLIVSSTSRASLKYNITSISELADVNDLLCLSLLLHTDKLSQDTIHGGSSSTLASARGITLLHKQQYLIPEGINAKV